LTGNQCAAQTHLSPADLGYFKLVLSRLADNAGRADALRDALNEGSTKFRLKASGTICDLRA
jgi:hypothetical protein